MDVKNKLFCGDNLKILKNFIPDDSVDLIYLDPPLTKDACIQQYRNEIVWCFDNKGQKDKAYEKCHDILLYYTKSEEYVFNS